jgi:hypothetical protein
LDKAKGIARRLKSARLTMARPDDAERYYACFVLAPLGYNIDAMINDAWERSPSLRHSWAEQGAKRRAQTLESMPRGRGVATVQNSDWPHSSASITAWILGSSPRMTKARGAPLPMR